MAHNLWFTVAKYPVSGHFRHNCNFPIWQLWQLLQGVDWYPNLSIWFSSSIICGYRPYLPPLPVRSPHTTPSKWEIFSSPAPWAQFPALTPGSRVHPHWRRRHRRAPGAHSRRRRFDIACDFPKFVLSTHALDV